MPLPARLLAGLVTGFLLGLALAGSTSPFTTTLVATLLFVGTVFINLIRMTVTPLVASMLVASVGSAGASADLGRTGRRVLALALVLLAVAALVTVAIAAPALAALPIDRAAALSLRPPDATSTGGTAATGAVSIVQWLTDLVPPNLVKAAADGATLPVILFAVLFGLALSRVGNERRDAVLRVAHGVADAMQRVVAGILRATPVAVFALAVPLASRLGLAAAGAVVAYVGLVVALTVFVGVALLYPAGILGSGMSPRAFTEYCLPAQTVAFASRSSLAALPAMIESAEKAKLPALASGLVVPLAASMLRVGAAVAMPVGALFLARLYGVVLTPPQFGSLVLTTILASFTVPGIPGGSIIAMVPLLTAVNVPVDGIGILLAVDTIPDMFRTTANVTASLMVASTLRRGSRS